MGKKKCYTCGVPVLMCDKCMTARPDKPGSGKELSVRCPICVRDDVTIPAADVVLTDNGVSVKAASGIAGIKALRMVSYYSLRSF